MLSEDCLAPYFIPVYYPFTCISTHPKSTLRVQSYGFYVLFYTSLA